MKQQLRITVILFYALILFILSGCDNEFPDYYNDKEFEVESFEGVKLGDAFQIEIDQSSTFSLIAEGENKDLDDLKVEVVNGILIVNYKPGTRNHKRTLLKISMPALKQAELHSASSSKISGFEDTNVDFQLKVTGASRVVTDTNWNTVDVRVDGASELVFKGIAEKLNARINGASRLQAAELTVNTVILEVGGSREASVNVIETLSGEVGGHSLLRYRGNPEVIDVEVAIDSQILHL